MKKLFVLPVVFLCSNAAMCAHDEPAVEVRTVEVVKEVQKPCPGDVPKRPLPLGPLPSDLGKLAAVLGAKVAEYAGKGGYADRADTWMQRCAGD